MGLYTAKSSLKGQVTVPAEVRQLIGLQPGGELQFRTMPGGKVEVVAKKRSIAHLKGIFARPSSPVDIDAAIAAEVADRNRPQHPRRGG